jgi:hypothetical protein
MSAGNITYPRGRSFRNTLVATDFRGYVDKDGKKHLLNTITGQDLLNTGQASTTLIGAMAATKRVAGINLNDDYPVLAGEAYDFGFGIKTVAREPGVGNDLPRGISKGYFSSTTRLGAAVSGKISTADMIAQVAEIKALVEADTGLGNVDGNIKGAIVDITANGIGLVATGTMTVTLTCDGVSFTVTAAATVDAAVALINANSAFYAKAHAFNLDGKLVIIPVDPSKAVTIGGTITAIADQGYPVLVVRTKAAYYEDYTFEVEVPDMSGFYAYSVLGNFTHKGLSSDDVYALFANRKNNRGFANMGRNVQPADQTWEKYIFKTTLSGNDFHGASHGSTQEIIEELYVPAGSSATVGANFIYTNAAGEEQSAVTFANLLAWWVA